MINIDADDMERRQVSPFTDFFWNLSDRRKLLVISAFRGPDFYNQAFPFSAPPEKQHAANKSAQAIKAILTARIRGLSLKSTVYYPGDVNRIPVIDREVSALRKHLKLMDKSYLHFVMHVIDAVQATTGHEVWGDKEKEIYEAYRNWEIELHSPRQK